MGVGVVVGLGAGLLAVRVVNRIQLAAPGLYPVLAGACGLAAFGLAANTGGSGFLAIYLAGIVLGNSRTVFQRGTFLFMDGLAWICQITMFVVLGLLSTPTDVLPVAGTGLLVSAVLILVARSAAVVPLLAPFGFSIREHALIAWVGLKGAVPIILATFPLMFGLPEGRLIFNVVFFVVLVSATLQGWTLPALATRLGLQEDAAPAPPAFLELLALRDVNAEIIDYSVSADSTLAGRTRRGLAPAGWRHRCPRLERWKLDRAPRFHTATSRRPPLRHRSNVGSRRRQPCPGPRRGIVDDDGCWHRDGRARYVRGLPGLSRPCSPCTGLARERGIDDSAADIAGEDARDRAAVAP